MRPDETTTAIEPDQEESHAALPARYGEVLNWVMTHNSSSAGGEAAADAGAAPAPGRNWVGALAVIAGVAFLIVPLGGLKALARGTGTENKTPFAAGNVLSVQAAGVASDLASIMPPAAATPSPAPAAESTPADDPLSLHSHTNPLDPASYVAAPTKPRCETCEAAKRAAMRAGARSVADAGPNYGRHGRTTRRLAELDDSEESDAEGGIVIRAAPPTPPAVVNVGTRVSVTLVYRVRTDAATVPVTATVTSDVMAGGRVAIPAGATLVGEAISTRDTDRMQMAFAALVIDGKTVALRGLAMGADGELGVPARLIRKATGGKSWLGKTAGALGNAATLGIFRGGTSGGLLEATADGLVARSGQDLNTLERRWSSQRSDKVLEVGAGQALTLYIESDLHIE